MSVTLALSVTGLTIRAAIVAGLAIAALLLTGWRKPARAEPRSPRAARSSSVPAVIVDQYDTPEYHRPGPIRRVLALAASSGIAVMIGIMSAIVIAFTVAFAIIWLTNLLQR